MMKKLMVLTITGLLFAGLTPRRSEADPSSANNINSLKQDAQNSLAQVQQARQKYLAAVQQYGENSPQAQGAKSQLDNARSTWQGKMAQVRQARQQAHAQFMQQRQARMQQRHMNNRMPGQ